MEASRGRAELHTPLREKSFERRSWLSRPLTPPLKGGGAVLVFKVSPGSQHKAVWTPRQLPPDLTRNGSVLLVPPSQYSSVPV